MNNIKPIETKYKGYRFRSRLEARWAVFFDALGLSWEYEIEGLDLNGTWYLPDFYINDWKCYIEIKPLIPKDLFFVDDDGNSAMLIAREDKLAYDENPFMRPILMNNSTVDDKNVGREFCYVFFGVPGVPEIIKGDDGIWKLRDGCIGISPFSENGHIRLHFRAFCVKKGELEIWSYYLPRESIQGMRFGFSDDGLSLFESIYKQASQGSGTSIQVVPSLPNTYILTIYTGKDDDISYNHPILVDAYKKARSARFEHGEDGR